MNKDKILLNYPIKFPSIRKSFSFFNTYDKIHELLKGKHKLNKKLRNMYGGGKEIYNSLEIQQAIERMNAELATLESKLIVGLDQFPSFYKNIQTMNDFLGNVINELNKDGLEYKKQYETIYGEIQKLFDGQITIGEFEQYNSKSKILEDAKRELRQDIKDKKFREAYRIIQDIYEKYKQEYIKYYKAFNDELQKRDFYTSLNNEQQQKINVYIQSLLLNDLFILEYDFLMSFTGYLGQFLKKFMVDVTTEQLTMVDIINQLTDKIKNIRDAFDKTIQEATQQETRSLVQRLSPIAGKIRKIIENEKYKDLRKEAETYKNLCYKSDTTEILDDNSLKLEIHKYFVENGSLVQEEYLKFISLYEDLTGAVRVYIRIRENDKIKDNEYFVSRFMLNYNPNYVKIHYREFKSCTGTNCCLTYDKLKEQIDSFLINNQMFCEGINTYTRTSTCPNSSHMYFGPFFGVFDKNDNTQKMFEGTSLEQEIDVNGKTHKPFVNGVSGTIGQVKEGYSIILFGYGFSGSGKTYTLLGAKNKDGTFNEGLIDYALRSLGSSLTKMECSIVEVYGERTALNLNKHDVKQFLFVYDIEGKTTEEPSATQYQAIKRVNEEVVEQLKNKMKFHDITNENMNDKIQYIKEWLNKIDVSRRKKQRVKFTSNNPESSRGHLFITLKLQFEDVVGYLTFVDMAGAEDVTSIINTEFEKYDPTRITSSSSVLSTWANGYSSYRPEGDTSPTVTTFDYNTFCGYLSYGHGKNRIDIGKIEDNIKEIAKRLEENDITVFDLGTRNRSNVPLYNNCIKFRGRTYKSIGSKYNGKDIFDMFVSYVSQDLNKTIKQGYFINDTLNHMKKFMLLKSGKDVEANALTFIQASSDVSDLEDTRKLIFTKYDKSLMVNMLRYLDSLSNDKITKFVMIGAVDPNPLKCQGTVDTISFMQTIKST